MRCARHRRRNCSRSSRPRCSRSQPSPPRGAATRRRAGTASRAKAASRINAIRIDAARAASLAEAETEIDVATFIQWVDADTHAETELADFYAARFRPEFTPAFDAWIATEPGTNPDAPNTPFAMPEYRVAAHAEADVLDQAAERSAAAVRRDIQRASNYVLGVVLFAVALSIAV